MKTTRTQEGDLLMYQKGKVTIVGVVLKDNLFKYYRIGDPGFTIFKLQDAIDRGFNKFVGCI